VLPHGALHAALHCHVQVVFSYNPSPGVPPVLRGLSFLAAGGHSLAVVGSTGSGKSTLLRCATHVLEAEVHRLKQQVK